MKAYKSKKIKTPCQNINEILFKMKTLNKNNPTKFTDTRTTDAEQNK